MKIDRWVANTSYYYRTNCNDLREATTVVASHSYGLGNCSLLQANHIVDFNVAQHEHERIFIMSPVFNRLLAVYQRLFPWSYRDRCGSPCISFLMGLKGNKVRFEDYTVFLNPNDKTATELFLIHTGAPSWIWESYEIGLFLASVQANAPCTVVDLGANYGAYTLSAGFLAKEGGIPFILAVEPNRDTFACLSNSIEYNGFSQSTQLFHAAVTAGHDEQCLFLPDSNYSAMSKAVCVGEMEAGATHGTYAVRGVTLDGLMSELKLPNDGRFVIKIDIEGSEPSAFQGMEKTLQSSEGYQVFFELHPGALQSLGHDPLKFAEYLFALQPDVIAEVDQHKKVTRVIKGIKEFEALVQECLTTTEMWKDYTNIFLSKGLKVPFEIRG